MTYFLLGENEMTFGVAEDFLKRKLKVGISEEKRRELDGLRKYVEGHIDREHAYYGINTGFGKMAGVKIDLDKLEELQENLIRSHAFGVGEPLEINQVRLMMLFRAHVVAMGYSAPSLPVVDMIIEMINRDVVPVVPSKGSVGASGDLSPLSYFALAMMGEGDVYFNGRKTDAASALEEAGLSPVKLGAKDGLTLVNGTQAMTALGTKAVLKARHLIKVFDISSALSIEGFRASSAPFSEEIHMIRKQIGQERSAEMIRRLIEGSEIISSHVHCSRVQDPYSFRCVPQVHGAVRDAFYFAEDVIEREMNSCTDNPLIFKETEKIISGGNFHGEPIAMAMDFLSIGMAELGSIAERRLAQLISPANADIPVPLLTNEAGLNSGFFMPHVVVSSLVSENKTLAHPASIDSIPTFGGQEDHVSMGMWAARKALKIIENVEWIGVIELMAAAQAIDLQEEKHKAGAGTQAAYEMIRKIVKFVERDRYIEPESKILFENVISGDYVDKIEAEIREWTI